VTKACERLVKKVSLEKSLAQEERHCDEASNSYTSQTASKKRLVSLFGVLVHNVMRRDNARKKTKRGTKPFYHDLPHECLPTIHLMDSLSPNDEKPYHFTHSHVVSPTSSVFGIFG